MNNYLLNINNIKGLIKSRNIVWTKHCLNRLNQRGILIADVKYAINNGCIIETYGNDYPFPSCLVLGRTISNKKLHIVCGVSQNTLYIITVYYPNTIDWSFDMKRRNF